MPCYRVLRFWVGFGQRPLQWVISRSGCRKACIWRARYDVTTLPYPNEKHVCGGYSSNWFHSLTTRYHQPPVDLDRLLAIIHLAQVACAQAGTWITSGIGVPFWTTGFQDMPSGLPALSPLYLARDIHIKNFQNTVRVPSPRLSVPAILDHTVFSLSLPTRTAPRRSDSPLVAVVLDYDTGDNLSLLRLNGAGWREGYSPHNPRLVRRFFTGKG